ncbi:MAG: hypothetical protein ACLU9S_00515 [Oscillospiraceae bacterium]
MPGIPTGREYLGTWEGKSAEPVRPACGELRLGLYGKASAQAFGETVGPGALTRSRRSASTAGIRRFWRQAAGRA